MSDQSCLFCQFVTGKIPTHKVWENDTHLAFLTIFPNTDGVTVVIPKEHKPSYLFDNDQETINNLMDATKQVAQKIDQSFDDVGRCGIIFEGFGIDHLHAKLYPMHGTGDMQEWKNIESSKPEEFYDVYPGFLSSHDGKREDDDKLREIAEIIKHT